MSVSRMLPVRIAERPSEFLGVSAVAERVREQIRAAAAGRATVLITGESGVGKELVAREIHLRSARGPGAFTDAKTVHHGAVERVHKGTIFLDEIGDLGERDGG